MSGIRRVYINLPKHLADRVFWPARKYRKNALSHIEGGVDVVVEFHDGRVLGYDWIKSTYAYISEIPGGIDSIVQIYARKCQPDLPQDAESFRQVWNVETSNSPLLPTLQSFDEEMGLTRRARVLDEDYVEAWVDPMDCGQYLPASEWREILGEEQYYLMIG